MMFAKGVLWSLQKLNYTRNQFENSREPIWKVKQGGWVYLSLEFEFLSLQFKKSKKKSSKRQKSNNKNSSHVWPTEYN